MALNKTTKRLIAARRPFSVVEIKNDPRITKVNGKQSAYNIVGKNGSGIAEFGCDELAALWFCEAANRYADEICSRRPAKPPRRNCDVGTPIEQHERFVNFCSSHQYYIDEFHGYDCKKDCPIGKMIDKNWEFADKCQFVFGQMPYEECEKKGVDNEHSILKDNGQSL